MHNCINLIKLTIKHNKKGFVINNTKKNINIIKPFLKLNIIKFIKIKDKKILIYMNYVNNKPIFNNIINMSKKSNKKTISFKTLKNISIKYNWIFLLSTNLGVINSFEALKNKSGGLLIAKIWN